MKKYNFMFISLLVLLFSILACSGTVTPTLAPTLTAKPSLFVYQVQVQTKAGTDIVNAETRIEVSGQALYTEVTDTNGIARFIIDSTRDDAPARLIVEVQGYKKHTQAIDLKSDSLSLIVQLEDEPTPLVIPSATFTQAVAIETTAPLADMPAVVTPIFTPLALATFVVSTELVTTNACYVPGNRIQVTTDGNITLGDSVGSTNADGKDSFEVLGVSVPIDKQFYIDRKYPLGALMCKLEAKSDWLLCGTSKLWDIDKAGCLIFQVNDNVTNNNSGSYTVTVETLK